MSDRKTEKQMPLGRLFAPPGTKRTGHPVIAFYLLAFAISWAGYAPLLVHRLAPSLFQSRYWLIALGLPGAGPAIAALFVTIWCARPNARKPSPAPSQLRHAFLRPVPARWWAATIVLSVGLMLLAALLGRHSLPEQGPLLHHRSWPAFLLFATISLFANPLEEIGWRGFAQVRLQQTLSALPAALIVGSLWAVWHIPLFLLSTGPMSMAQTPFWPWVAGVIPQAILLAWLLNRTRSLATVSICHLLGNLSGMIFDPPAVMVATVRIVAALAVIGLAGSSLGNRKENLGID